jgi:hypothetical protein
MTDMIIARQETRNLPQRGPVTLMHFHQGMVLLVSASAVGLYRDAAAVTDPLGNGALGYETIPESLQPHWQEEGGYIREQRAGYVALTSGAALFIRPDGVGLYDSGAAVLKNQPPHWLIPFSLPA